MALLSSLSPSPANGYGVFQIIYHRATGFEGLDEIESTAISPDGLHLYTGGLDAIMVLSRNPIDGSLTHIETLRSEAVGGSGIFFFSSLRVSPDGLNVYAASATYSAVVVFSRDPSGRLTLVEVVNDNVNGADGLRIVFDLEISPDGRQLYTLGTGEREIGVFSRDPVSGRLSLIDLENGVGEIPEMVSPRAMTLTPDGRHLYVGNRPTSLLVFSRQLDDGSLTYEGALDGSAIRDVQPFDVISSPDGATLYLSGTSPMGSAVVGFERNPVSGALTQSSAVFGVEAISHLVIDETGSTVFATGGDRLQVLARDSQGQLMPRQTLRDGIDGVEGLLGIGLGVLAPGGRHFYAPAFSDEAIVRFWRPSPLSDLMFVDAIYDGQGTTLDGLGGPSFLHAPADGQDIYLAERENKVVVQYRRDTAGHLDLSQVVSMEDIGFDEFDEIYDFFGSPDGRYLVVVKELVKELFIFRRSPADGSLQFLRRQGLEMDFFDAIFSFDSRYLLTSKGGELGLRELAADGELNPVPLRIFGLPSSPAAFTRLAIDPSGRFIYGGGRSLEPESPGVIGVYEWDRAAETLQLQEEVSHPDLGESVSGMLVTPDGRYLLATGFGNRGAGPEGLVVFARHAETGTLTEVQSLVDGVDGLRGFVEPRMGELSNEARLLVVAGTDADSRKAVSTFLELDPSTGRLRVEQQRTEGDGNGPDDIRTYRGLVWGPTDDQFFTTSVLGDKLYGFDIDALTPCVPGPSTLCLGQDQRFRVEVSWTDFAGDMGVGSRVTASAGSGLFWFFDAANWEMLVKVIDGCDLNGHHWVFAAATTNVAYTLTVTDTSSGETAVYENPLGFSAAAITDTEALSGCF